MSIDIHISNYEEFLYSYVDGELTAEEAAALELFLDKHPHLRTELDQLMATRLQPEDLVFSDKAALYKSSRQTESYETQLLSYMDGELGPQETLELERFMEAHPRLRQELEVWEKTRLVPDLNVRFGNKSALYRHNTRTVRMRPAYWWAAAAMLAGSLFLLRNTFTQDDTAIAPPIVANNQPSQSTAPAVENTRPETPAAAENAEQGQAAPAQEENASAGKTENDHTAAAPRPALAQVVADDGNAGAAAANAREPEQTVADLSSLRTQPVPEPATRETVNADLSGSLPKVKANENLLAANNKPSIDIQAAANLATPPPAQEPGELIMSVTGNGLESKVLDKVTNVAKLFSKKRNNK